MKPDVTVNAGAPAAPCPATSTDTVRVRVAQGVARAMIGSAVGWLVGGLGGAIVGVATVVAGPWWLARRRTETDREQVEAGLAAIAELAARSSRSGLSLSQALHEAAGDVGGVAGELVSALLARARSTPFHAACREWGAVADSPGVPILAAAIGVAATGSGSGARALEAAARTLRDRAATQCELQAWATQARSSAVLLGAMPLGFAVVALVTRPGAVEAVLSQPLALGSVALGLVAEAAGAWWMLRLVARAQASA